MRLSEGYHAEVEVRWSDMDVFQHINHARMVTLLEEARIPWLFEDDRPTVSLRDGAVVADLHVRYRGQLRHGDSPLDVLMWVEKVRAVDFTICYEVRPKGVDVSVPASVIASTQIAAFDVDTQRLRRLTESESEYLKSWQRV
ncbi:4-hydroxybenzoyl-CoA thioesterase [Rhodococcus sp. WMMA185]|uniref:acyl-CoA thioesterase n=1 Tax=Rhodococcus sp. WMMA185 TaxID=679318 RepID=UPI000878B056|nr:thioesterase family protein [Rhodococcus sp. WMMA185]AOW92983.1 4-hydroxybenzoyl-CoA thioesterase [Rhodococcus sp. WMMA185]